MFPSMKLLQKWKAHDVIELKNCEQRLYLHGTSLLRTDIQLIILFIVITSLQDRDKENIIIHISQMKKI